MDYFSFFLKKKGKMLSFIPPPILFRNTNYGKACPNFPENIECCINSDDPPSSQFEQLIQQIDQSHDKKESQQQKQLNNHNSQNDANANLWPLSNDAISWLDTAPLDTWY